MSRRRSPLRLAAVAAATAVVVAAGAAYATSSSDPTRPHGTSHTSGHRGMRQMSGMPMGGAPSTTLPRQPVAAAGAAQPSSASMTIENGGKFIWHFNPQALQLAPGGSLTVTNNTSIDHSVTSDAIGIDNKPLFSKVVPADTANVSIPVSSLSDGVYTFHCKFHPQMTGSLTIGTGGPVTTLPKFEQRLYQPPRLHGGHLKIVMRKARVRILPHGPRTPMWTYGGTFPGPTIVRRTGRDTHVTFVNHLPRRAGAVTVHQHGGHQASKYDGQPNRFLIRHGGRFTYDWPLRDNGKPIPASLRFYHDHRMMRTARNNWRGLQGMFLTTDPGDARRGLPTGRFDIPLDVTERSFTRNNHLTNPFRHRTMSMPAGAAAGSAIPDPPSGTVGDQVLVNGRFAPYKKVLPGIYRLRLLNTSLFSSYDFELADGRAFDQIGTGSGLLPHAVTRHDILLGPAQRADVLVDFRGLSGHNVLLQSIPRSDGAGGGTGSHVAVLMQFRVRGSKPHQHVRVPDPLGKIEHLRLPRKVAMTWNFGVSKDRHGSYWSINGRRFSPRRVDHRVRLGSVEKWRIHNSSDMTHFVHLHEEEWLTISRDGKRPPPWERGYEDTWRLDPGETVVVAAQFTDFTGDFMIHCHMLDHEDDSMMATWRVARRK